ncbi:MAG: hypothetical protein WAM44_19815 [Chthoniobacterales bacterium]
MMRRPSEKLNEWEPNRLKLSLRDLAEALADCLGAREEVRELSDLEAVRLLQQREGYTPCYGREIALQPGPDGICLVSECFWRNFCSAYRSQAVPLEGCLSRMPNRRDLASFSDFLLARGPESPGPRVPG